VLEALRAGCAQTAKLHIAKVMILDLQPDAIISGHASK
jgi:hypothetical protein